MTKPKFRSAAVSFGHSSFDHYFVIRHSCFVIMIQDLRLAFRSLTNTPGFTLVAIVTIALAIGANTTIFSLVNALLLRPLPYKNPQELVLLWEKFSAQGLDRIPVSAPEYLDYEKELKSLEIAGFDYTDLNLTAGDMPERIAGAVVTPSLFPVLGVEPMRGRTFTQERVWRGQRQRGCRQ